MTHTHTTTANVDANVNVKIESSKRKPLSDMTNTYDLIHISALRKLVAGPSTSNSFSKPPISISKSNSNSMNQKFFSESSSRSNTSIGSSNVSTTMNSKKIVQFPSPPRVITSIGSPGGIGSKDAAYNRKQIIEQSKKEREANVIVSSTPVEKRKDKGKAIAVPFSSSPSEKMKNYQNDICNPGTPFQRQNQIGMANLSLSSGSVEMVKKPERGVLNSYSCSFEKAQKGKAILNSSSRALRKQIEIGKGITGKSSCLLEKTNDGKATVKIKEMGQEFLNPSSFLVESAKDKGKPLNTYNSSHEKTKEKGKEILQPSGIVEIAGHKGSRAAVAVKSRPPRRKSEKRKFDAGASSCPPKLRPKSVQTDLDEARDVKSSKSWTDPRPKCRKKMCLRIETTSELPRDFIQQQKAYFKEVDEFELLEEEVTPDELD